MLVFQGLIGSVTDKMMLVATLIVIFFLIAFELIRVEKDENEANKLFNPTILFLIAIFVFIVITKVMAILK